MSQRSTQITSSKEREKVINNKAFFPKKCGYNNENVGEDCICGI